MAREQENYRDNLQLLTEMFPGKLALTIQECCQVCGVKDRRTLLKDRAFPARMIAGRYQIPIADLARYL
jgi:hypothetical protein